MIKTTKWSPDTCGCSISYQWDSEVPEAERVHTPVESVKCEFHKNHPDVKSHFGAIEEENGRKNVAIAEILENAPSIVEEVEDADGRKQKTFKSGKEPKWHFDENRNIVFDLDHLKPAEKAATKSALFRKHGARAKAQ